MPLSQVKRDRHREYMRARYRNDPAHRAKQIARSAVAKAVKRGQIERKPCERCGCEQSEGHHNDYTKKLEVIWLCRRCHRAEHAAY